MDEKLTTIDNGVAPHIHIIRRENGYAVFSNNLRPYGTFSTLRKALTKAYSLQKIQGGIIAVHQEDGRVSQLYRPIALKKHSVADTGKITSPKSRPPIEPRKLKPHYV